MQTQERRNSRRVPIFSKGVAILAGDDVALTTHDVSLGGALVKFSAPHTLKAGTAIQLSLDVGFIGQSTVCRVITNNDPTLCGLKFDDINHASYLRLGINILNYQKTLIEKISG